MKALKYILLSFVFVIWFSCSKAPKPNIYEHLKPCDINLKTKNPILKSSFTHAVLLADSMVATMFGTDSVLMSMYRKYNFEYIKSCSKGVNDSLPDYPNSFVITYSLKYNGDTIPSPTTIEIDKFGKITHCYFPGFIGLVEAYRNKWKIKNRAQLNDMKSLLKRSQMDYIKSKHIRKRIRQLRNGSQIQSIARLRNWLEMTRFWQG